MLTYKKVNKYCLDDLVNRGLAMVHVTKRASISVRIEPAITQSKAKTLAITPPCWAHIQQEMVNPCL